LDFARSWDTITFGSNMFAATGRKRPYELTN